MDSTTTSVPLLQRLDALDRRWSERLLARPASAPTRALVGLLRRISQTGSYGTGWIAMFAVVVTLLEDWTIAAIAAACVIGMLLLNTAVKLVIRRPRPAGHTIGKQPTTHSMPSAHTSMAMVGATAMTVVAPGFWWLWWGWAAILGISRIVLGMHFLGDVLAGALVGLVVSAAAVAPVLGALVD